jgi:hypothetical protein
MVYIIPVCESSGIYHTGLREQWYISYRFARAMVYIITVCESNGIYHTGLREQWYISYRFTRAMVYIIPVCESNGIYHTGLREQWYISYQFARAMVYIIPVCESNGKYHTGLRTACKQDQDGTASSSNLILLASCQQICMTYTTAVCTVKNYWWWTEELSETCRVSFQNKIEELVYLVSFIMRNCLNAQYGNW